jgi:hypothetical protein
MCDDMRGEEDIPLLAVAVTEWYYINGLYFRGPIDKKGGKFKSVQKIVDP